MSWFDTSGIANLAKSALKEAQKTIDKALDIKDEEQSENQITTNTPITPPQEESDFFASWGIKSSNELKRSFSEKEDEIDLKQANKNVLTSSLWGSFTGSFFENPKGDYLHL